MLAAAAAAAAAARDDGSPDINDMNGTDDDGSPDIDAAPARVLFVCGSETGNAKRGVQRLAKFWRDGCDGSYYLEASDVVDGDAVTASLEEIRAQYDVLIIATSSFGEGDPPENYAGPA